MLCFTLLYTFEFINKLYFFRFSQTLTFLSVADEYHHGDDTKQDGGRHDDENHLEFEFTLAFLDLLQKFYRK